VLVEHRRPLAFHAKANIFRVDKADAANGPGHSQFGRALYELNIDGMRQTPSPTYKGGRRLNSTRSENDLSVRRPLRRRGWAAGCWLDAVSAAVETRSGEGMVRVLNDSKRKE
jgi:hypothetical protein